LVSALTDKLSGCDGIAERRSLRLLVVLTDGCTLRHAAFWDLLHYGCSFADNQVALKDINMDSWITNA
jgi:hypothetical protein